MSQMFKGGIRQLGYVVRDIEKAMQGWIDLGVGPWFYKSKVTYPIFRYMGQDSPSPLLSYASANSGDMQIELIQQHDDKPSLYLDSMNRSGEGMQHVAYWIESDFDARVKELMAQGYVEGMAGQFSPERGGWSYLIRSDFPSVMVELSAQGEQKRAYFEEIRQAAVNWDGKEPIRRR